MKTEEKMSIEKIDPKINVSNQKHQNETATILDKSHYVELVNPYVNIARDNETEGIYLEERSRSYRGKWREEVFKVDAKVPLDLEVGVGNGLFFEHRAVQFPQRCLLGIERKFKPLVQSWRRARNAGIENAHLLRYQADYLEEIFAENELNNIFLFFPDPWPKRRHHKNRLVNDHFLKSTFALQQSGSFIEMKTDSYDYYFWMLGFAEMSDYRIEVRCEDLHASPWAENNFMTHFEKLWTRKGLKTHYLKLVK